MSKQGGVRLRLCIFRINTAHSTSQSHAQAALNATQTAPLAWTGVHCELCNAALTRRTDTWRTIWKSVSHDEQQYALPKIKAACPNFIELGSHALQQMLRRKQMICSSV